MDSAVRLPYGDTRDNGASDPTDAATRFHSLSEPVTTAINATRWAFLERFFYCWFELSEYQDQDTAPLETPALAFDAFRVFLPWATCPAPAQLLLIQQLVDATELVGYMFYLDKSAWWFVKERFKPWFHTFQPSDYDPKTLVPKMRFVLHQRFVHRDDQADAVRILYQVLCGDHQLTDDAHSQGYHEAKAKLLRDHRNELRGFQIPIAFEFAPEAPCSPDQLQGYLVDVIALVDAVNRQTRSPDSAFPFRLEDIQLKLYMHQLNDVQDELRRLLSLGVPVNIQLRQLDESSGMSCSVDDCINSSTMYAALAHDPAALSASEPTGVKHKLDHRMIYSSPELWSALAFAPNLTELAIHQQFLEDKETRATHAKWLGYSLSHTRVRSLSLTMFEPTENEMDTIHDVALSPDPTRLLRSPNKQSEVCDDGPQVVSLKPHALIQTTHGDQRTLAQLSIPTDWRFPVVCVNTNEDHIEFVVPGHAVCCASMASVLSVDMTPAQAKPTFEGEGLHSLAIYSDEQRPGVAARFVELFGRSLRRFRWAGDDLIALPEEPPFDQDLVGVLASCPLLETVVMKERKLQSLDALMHYCENHQFNLRSLTLANVSLTLPEMIKFFNQLANPRLQLSRKLQHLSYESAFDGASIDAAVAMLRTNRVLSYVDFGMSEDVCDVHQHRFEAERGVFVRVDRLPLRAKLAFLSVVQFQESSGSNSALSRLDSSCTSLIFECFGRLTAREITIRSV